MICIVDYGMGNLRSVSKAIEHLGAKVEVSSTFRDIERADKIVLPGVGEFGSAMRELRNRSLIEPIRSHIDKNKPFLGICLGLQLLLDRSEESSRAAGLSIIPGTVRALKNQIKTSLKVPQMGWNQVRFTRKSLLTKNLSERESFFYFVHSFYAKPADQSSVLGITDYGIKFASILEREPVFAVQFHPEKSQRAGLKILENFISY